MHLRESGYNGGTFWQTNRRFDCKGLKMVWGGFSICSRSAMPSGEGTNTGEGCAVSVARSIVGSLSESVSKPLVFCLLRAREMVAEDLLALVCSASMRTFLL